MPSNLRLYFIAYVFGVLCIAVAISALITFVLNLFVTSSVVIPSLIWMLLFSIVLGTVINAYLSKWILLPISNLSNAMNNVAGGDFAVMLQSRSKIPEIKNMYANFNLMVRALKATATLQNDFVSNVSHEIKTPINAIEGYATLLQDQPQSDEEKLEYIDKILFNTRRLSGLVSNILLISKVENQTIHVEKQAYRLDEQIRQSILALEQKWSEKSIEFDIDMEPVEYCGNESLMLHVWTNLIANAIKFDPYGGMIRIRLKADAKGIEFAIEDSGPGISAAAQKHIYDKFYQEDNSHTAEGNGLGLALVKRILDTCGGEIQIKSNLDCGSRFTVTLPASD